MVDPLVLRKTLQAGKPIIAAAMGTASPVFVEMMSRIDGFDALLLDFQHSPATDADMIPAFQAMRAGGGIPFPRVGWNDPQMISRILDAGALGIICPMTNTREEVERFVGAARFAPQGFRSFGPMIPSMVYPGYAEKANEAIILLAMIETRTAVENLDEILAVPGLDGVFIGQTDLSLSLGHTPRPDWRDGEPWDVTKRILDATLAAGKIPGIMCASTDFAREMVDAGFLFIGAPSEGLLRPAIEQSLATIRRTA